MKEKKMVALSVGKKRELGALSSMLAKTVGVVSLVAILASCGTSPGYSYTVGGTVSGLAGSGLVLQNNGGDDHLISADGYFTFATPLTNEAAYNITVKTQPTNPTQTCTVFSDGTGTIISAPVVDVVVSCMTSPTSIAFSVESGNEFAHVANENSTILTYLINPDGTFGPVVLPAAKTINRNLVIMNDSFMPGVPQNVTWSVTDESSEQMLGQDSFEITVNNGFNEERAIKFNTPEVSINHNLVLYIQSHMEGLPQGDYKVQYRFVVNPK